MATKKKVVKDNKKTSKENTVIKKVEDKGSTIVKNIVKSLSDPAVLVTVLAEFIGTFVLATVVCISNGQPLMLMFALMAVVLMIGTVSGAYVNPLLTVGAWATKRISTAKALLYVIAQVLGAMLSFVLVKSYIDSLGVGDASQLGQAPQMFSATKITEGKEMLVLFAELLGAFIFSFAVARVTDKNDEKTDIAKAFGVGGAGLVAVFIANTFASIMGGIAIVNPAIAVTLQAFTIKDQSASWSFAIYLGAALIGGILGFVLNSLMNNASKK